MSLMRINRATVGSLGDIIAGRPDLMPDPDRRVLLRPPEPAAGVEKSDWYSQWFRATQTPGARVNEMKYYDYLEREIADVRKALDVFATMAVTGNLTGGGRNTFSISILNEENQYPQQLLDRFKQLELLIQTNAFATIRAMVKYGTYTPQIIVGRKDDARLGVVKIKPIPPGTIFRNIKPKGVVDPERYWIQVIDGVVVGQGNQKFSGAFQETAIPQWILPSFSLWANVVSATETLLYGTSILQPFGAIGLKVHASVDAIVVARLSRAAMRYVWKIDVSDISKDQNAIKRRVNMWQRLLGRSTSLLNEATNIETYQRTPVPDADFFLPSADGLKWDLNTITGDTNLSRVADVELLIRFYFGALGVPPEYLGHERSQGGRSVLTQIDIHFARTIRHIQMFAASGFLHIVLVDMILGGWDPRKYPIKILPPPIGARDELLKAQIRALQSAVIANLRAAGMRLEVNPRWILETFLLMDEELEGLKPEQIDKLFGPAETNGKPPSAEERQRLWDIMSTTTGDLMGLVRENIRMLALGKDPMVGGIYDQNQPSADELAAAIEAG